MLAPVHKQIAGILAIVAALVAALAPIPSQWKVGLLAPLSAGLALVLQAHASRRGGWDQVSILASALIGMMALGGLVIAGFVWLGFTTGFAD